MDGRLHRFPATSINAVLPGPTEDYFEIKYWGHCYKEGAARLREFVTDRTRPRYLMIHSRKAFFSSVLQGIDRVYEPVFTIRRQRGALLKIFKNTAFKSGGASEAG